MTSSVQRCSFAARAMRRLCTTVVALLAIAFVLLGAPPAARASSDPDLAWYTITTPHFRITYHSGLDQIAQHVANVAESIYGNMSLAVGWVPGELTEISLVDVNESANGSAGALPYNAIRLLVTAPEDMSPLGDVDDWYLELVTHEYTHILHTDHIRGLPAIVNAVLGKTLAPNQVQPRWILEGLGVYEESARTSAGRVRNSQWEMWMRADVL
ncbi:MAG: tolB protein precursor, partial [Myxococcaceae bacterium]|nr:tolB protein precursor [Myxococcaceae bacterium]